RHATMTIPIVIAAINYDPLARGYVASLARPGGNVTGVFYPQLALNAKQLELLKEALPGGRRFVVLWERFSADQLPSIDAAARSLKVELEKIEVTAPYDLDAAFAR